MVRRCRLSFVEWAQAHQGVKRKSNAPIDPNSPRFALPDRRGGVDVVSAADQRDRRRAAGIGHGLRHGNAETFRGSKEVSKVFDPTLVSGRPDVGIGSGDFDDGIFEMVGRVSDPP